MDSRTAVNDVKFAPRHLGLQLVSDHCHNYDTLGVYCLLYNMCLQASCSTDGQLRIYEAPDVMNLSQWTLNVCFPLSFCALIFT